MTRRNSRYNSQTATTFDRYSETNAETIRKAIADRKANGLYLACNCQPYADTFTFERWKAQGLVVRKGEKNLTAVNVVKEVVKTEDGKEARKTIPWRSYIFCRCQVKTCDDNATETAAGRDEARCDEIALNQAEPEINVLTNNRARFSAVEL